jgi:hypothetical protein
MIRFRLIPLAASLVLATTLFSSAAEADGGSGSETQPTATASTANNGATVILTQTGQTEPALGGAIAAQPRCAWTEIVPYGLAATGGAILLPYEPNPGSGLYLRAWNNCTPTPVILLDTTPAETADRMWAQTIANLPVATYELNPPVEWGAIVNVPNWIYAGPNIVPFTKTGGFATHQITIRAVPAMMTVDWGDKTVQPCRTLGIPYASISHPALLYLQARETAPPAACTHTYKHHSGHQPNEAYPVTMAITWNATWTSATGQSGTFNPYTQTTTANMKVDQIQTILTYTP